MSDLTSVWTIPLVPVQAEYWHISANNAGRNLSGNIFVSDPCVVREVNMDPEFPVSHTLDAWCRQSSSCPGDTMAGTLTSTFLVYDLVLPNDGVLGDNSRLDTIHRRPFARIVYHHTTSCWPDHHPRHVFLPW